MGAAMAYYRHWKSKRTNIYYVPDGKGGFEDAILKWERRWKIGVWILAATLVVLGLRSLDGSWPFGPTGFL